jgi:hypothetical protein
MEKLHEFDPSNYFDGLVVEDLDNEITDRRLIGKLLLH